MLSRPWTFRIPRFVALIGLLVSLTIESQAATWYVRPAGGGSGTAWGDALASFQAAINSATAGDEIWGGSGVYNESITLKSGIALYGGFAAVETERQDRDFAANPTILDATGLNRRVITANRSERVMIDGFTIRNGYSSAGGGIYFENVSSATVSNCTISDNTTYFIDGGGVYCMSASPTLTHCTISGNTARGVGGGVSCDRSSPILTDCTISVNTAGGNGGGIFCLRSSPTLTHCTISDNTTGESGGGVYCMVFSSPTLTHCTITGNTSGYGGGVFCSTSSPTLTNCILWNPGDEIFVVSGEPVIRYSCAQGGYAGEDNIDAYPQFVDPFNGDWRLRNESPCIDRGADVGLPFSGAGPDMGSWEAPKTYSQGPPDHVPQLYRVDSAAPTGGDGLSWETAFSTFREALFFCSTSDEIWVAAGSYYGSITMKTGLALYGGFAGTETNREDRDFVSNPTILDAAVLNQRVITANGTEGVTINGFTIRNGSTPTFGPTSFRVGAGIFFEDVSSATVANCLISGNTAAYGGGVYCSSSSPTLTHCTISSNTAEDGGGVYCVSSSPTLTHCTVSSNTAWASFSHGGGLSCFSSSPALTHCTISGNAARYGGGVYCQSDSLPRLTECTITGNKAFQGGGVHCQSDSSPTLTHCTISGNTGDDGGGVYCLSSSPTLAHCTISGNTAKSSLGNGGGVHCSSSSPTLTHCAISGNTARNGGGVYCSSSSPSLTHCTISENTADESGSVVYCAASSSPALTHCTITGNKARYGGAVHCSSSSPMLTNCILWNHGNEIFVVSGVPMVWYSCAQGGYPGAGNIDAYPQFVDPLKGDWRLKDGSPCIDRGTDVGLLFNGAGPDMGSWEAPESFAQGSPDHVPQLLRVNHAALLGGDGLSWETAFPSISEALFFSSNSDEIWVAAGTYNESITMKTGLALYGGFAGTETVREDRDFAANPTILDATGLNQRVITADGTERVTIDGFTIRNGKPPTFGPTQFRAGAGIYFNGVSAATVSNCLISGNAVSPGGGVYLFASSPTLTYCIISNNAGGEGGGLACIASSSPTLTHCTISGNTTGGGVYCSSSSPTLTHCTISGNSASSGGGVHCVSSSSPRLTNCILASNTATGRGGGLVCSSSSPTLTHCTIVRNTANYDASGVHVSGLSSSPTLTNCILWNHGDELTMDSGSPVVRYSCVQGGYPGEGNIDAHPQLVDPLNGDWRLRDGSPCIDRGADIGLPFNGAGPDMGSWEAPESFAQGPPFTIPQRFYVDSGASKGGDGLTWETAFPTVEEALLQSWAADEIWVSAGTYHESIHLEPGLRLYGGFAGTETSRADRDVMANTTILDASGLNRRVITAIRSEAITIDGFTIQNGDISAAGGGIYFNNVSSATVSNCTISGNRAGNRGGGVSAETSSPTLINCAITGNTARYNGGGVYCIRSSPTLTNCTISYNTLTGSTGGGGGLYCSSSSPTLTHCAISDNTGSNIGGGVYCISASSPTLTHCTISGNTASSRGGGMSISGSASSPTLTWCMIVGNTSNGDGGGVYCNRSTPSLTHCTIARNIVTGSFTTGRGAGLYCMFSSPTLTHCTITGNLTNRDGGGMHFNDESSPTLTLCTITHNTAERDGGGVYCRGSSSPTLNHCTISGNTANNDGGGVYSGGSLLTLTNCTISGNDTNRRGGGVHCNNSSASLTNCTITGNTAASGGGVASLTTSAPRLINSILWNGGDEVFLESATAEVTFSAVQGGYPGEGNIDEDPMFVDPEQSDYRLAMGSPCIDSGSNGAVLRLGPSQLAMGDHLGRMRIWDGDSDEFAAVDMGAYEFGPPPFMGDVFGDSRVNHLDLFRFQEVWKQEGDGIIPEADQDGDRTIGAADLVVLLHAWGNVTGP